MFGTELHERRLGCSTKSRLACCGDEMGGRTFCDGVDTDGEDTDGEDLGR